MSIRSNSSVHIAYASALIIAILFKMAGGKCNSQQARSCRDGVANHQLETIPPGGICASKEYVGQFTHECTVSSYKPGIDYCCCQYKTRAMCCLYHQTWNRFRCNQEDDTIDTFPWKMDDDAYSDGISALSIPLLIAVPIIILLAVVIAFLAYFWKRRRANRESRKEGDGLCSYKFCYSDRDSEDEGKDPADEVTRQKPSTPVVDPHFSGTVGLLGFPLHTAEKYPGPPPDREETTGLLPSAPPLSAELDSYAVCDSKGERCSVVSASENSGENDYNPQQLGGLLPPPLYEHHHHHRPAPDC